MLPRVALIVKCDYHLSVTLPKSVTTGHTQRHTQTDIGQSDLYKTLC